MKTVRMVLILAAIGGIAVIANSIVVKGMKVVK